MQQIGGLVAEVVATQIGRFQRRRIDQLGLLVESGLENLLNRASCKTPPRELLGRGIRSLGAIFVAREVAVAERLT